MEIIIIIPCRWFNLLASEMMINSKHSPDRILSFFCGFVSLDDFGIVSSGRSFPPWRWALQLPFIGISNQSMINQQRSRPIKISYFDRRIYWILSNHLSGENLTAILSTKTMSYCQTGQRPRSSSTTPITPSTTLALAVPFWGSEIPQYADDMSRPPMMGRRKRLVDQMVAVAP